MTNTTTTTEKNELKNALMNFEKALQYEIDKNSDIVISMHEKQFNEYNIEWSSKDFIIAKTKLQLFKQIQFEIEEEIVTWDCLQEFLIDKLKSLTRTAKIYRHNSTCPWRNAINFANNEATLEVIDFITIYIF